MIYNRPSPSEDGVGGSPMRANRFLATIAAGLGVIALVPVATVLGDDSADNPGQTIEAVTALGTAFTYQGRLTDGGSPANGAYDLRFILYDADTGGAQSGSIVAREDVPVANGLFSVDLDFGASVFNGEARWIEIAVRPGSGSGTGGYTVLSPRQPVSPTPYALFAKAAAGLAVPFAATAGSAGAPSTTTGLITVTQTGTGIAITGSRTSTDASAYPAVLGTNTGGGAGVQGESVYADGVGVQGFSTGATGAGGSFTGATGVEATGNPAGSPSLNLSGPIRVSGSHPTAFQHIVDVAGSGQNTCAGDNTITIIDNPVTNGDPSALLFVSLVDPTSSGLQGIQSGIAAIYDSDACAAATDKWAVYTTASPAVELDEALRINVLVIQR